MEDFCHIKKRSHKFNLLPTYSPIAIIMRVIWAAFVAVFIMRFIIFTFGPLEDSPGPSIQEYLTIIFNFILMGELLIVLDSILEHFLPIPKKFKLRMFLNTLLSLVLLFGIFSVTIAITKDNSPEEFTEIIRPAYYMGIALGLVFVSFTSTSLVIIRFMKRWQDDQQRMDDLEQEKLRMDYNALQDQLNPHFLFNNLSVLKSLILYDHKTAFKFTENFTDVYRYVLQSKDKMLVQFTEEIGFIDSFIGLHKERLNEGLNVKFSIEKNSLTKEIAPLTLQLLIENAIKHNVTSKESPLEILIKTENDYLMVENSLKLKDASYSTHTGLKNLLKRYAILTEKKVVISHESTLFTVKIPLL